MRDAITSTHLCCHGFHCNSCWIDNSLGFLEWDVIWWSLSTAIYASHSCLNGASRRSVVLILETIDMISCPRLAAFYQSQTLCVPLSCMDVSFLIGVLRHMLCHWSLTWGLFSCLNPSLCQFLYMGGVDWIWACDQLVNNGRITDSGQNETYLYCCSRAVSGFILNKFALRIQDWIAWPMIELHYKNFGWQMWWSRFRPAVCFA
jgi:hypothetical protein